MTLTTLTRTALTMALMVAVTLAATLTSHADEQTTPADAVRAPAPVAPAPDAAPAIEPAGGCMPGGGCCGVCQQAAAPVAPGDTGPRAATGGCTCQKNRQKPAS